MFSLTGAVDTLRPKESCIVKASYLSCTNLMIRPQASGLRLESESSSDPIRFWSTRKVIFSRAAWLPYSLAHLPLFFHSYVKLQRSVLAIFMI